jgi:hypothetical protein
MCLPTRAFQDVIDTGHPSTATSKLLSRDTM